MFGSPKKFCVTVLTRFGPRALPIVNMNRKVAVILARILLGTMAWKAAFCGPVPMPTMDRIAQEGLRYNNFHTTALCSPTRAALKSGRNHHVNNMGSITEFATGFPGQTGQIPNSVAPVSEMLRLNVAIPPSASPNPLGVLGGDIAGFIVGVVERARLITGATIAPGDVLIGVPSTGLHTNGYSLARRIAFDHLQLKVDSLVPELGRTIGDALLEPHRSYLSLIKPLLATGSIKGMAHITGGGITENLPRILPDGRAARIRTSSWTVPRLFTWLQESGRVPSSDMMRTFNMGIGLIVAVAPDKADHVKSALGGSIIGEIVPGESAVSYV